MSATEAQLLFFGLVVGTFVAGPAAAFLAKRNYLTAVTIQIFAGALAAIYLAAAQSDLLWRFAKSITLIVALEIIFARLGRKLAPAVAGGLLGAIVSVIWWGGIA